MTDFYRLLSSYREAVTQAALNPGPRQINWLSETELKLIAYVGNIQNKIDVMLDLYPRGLDEQI